MIYRMKTNWSSFPFQWSGLYLFYNLSSPLSTQQYTHVFSFIFLLFHCSSVFPLQWSLGQKWATSLTRWQKKTRGDILKESKLSSANSQVHKTYLQQTNKKTPGRTKKKNPNGAGKPPGRKKQLKKKKKKKQQQQSQALGFELPCLVFSSPCSF